MLFQSRVTQMTNCICPGELKVLLSTSEHMFFHNFPIILQISSHIQCMYNKLSVSVPLQNIFSPMSGGNTAHHLVIHLLQVAQASTLGCLLESNLSPPPCHQTMINASPLYQHTCPVWFVYCEPIHHIVGKISLLLHSSFLPLFSQQQFITQSLPVLTRVPLAPASLFYLKGTDNKNWGFCPDYISSPQNLSPAAATRLVPHFFN